MRRERDASPRMSVAVRVVMRRNVRVEPGHAVVLPGSARDGPSPMRAAGGRGTYDNGRVGPRGRPSSSGHALLLTGGDVYGFDAVRGIRRFLLEKKLASARAAEPCPASWG